MYNFLLFLFVINAIVLTFAILMQRDNKGISGVSVFGQGGDSAFGGRETASFLHKLTIYLTIVFFVLAISISLKSKSEFAPKDNMQNSSVIMERSAKSSSSPLENPLKEVKTNSKTQEEAVKSEPSKTEANPNSTTKEDNKEK